MEQIRCPRLRTIINNTISFSGIEAVISSSRSLEAASFHLDADSERLTNDIGPAWQEIVGLQVEIQCSVDNNARALTNGGWTSLIVGIVDTIEYNPATHRVTLIGRDRSAILIDQPLSCSYLNRTSSEIVSQICQDSGVLYNIEKTNRLVGQYYQIQHSKTSLSTFARHASSWDLLVELADIEGFDLWITGNTLNFLPSTETKDADALIMYNQQKRTYVSSKLEILSLMMTKRLALTQPLQVTVDSWNSRQKILVRAFYPPGSTSMAMRYTITKPNLLLDEAQLIAQSAYGQIIRHARSLTCTMAGETALTSRSTLQLNGLSSGWNGYYQVDRLERKISFAAGYVQHVSATAIAGGSDAEFT